jgi:aspartate/methionine/tyrosine aminotransferase
MLRVDQTQPSNALQKLEESFQVHKERMENVMQYLDASKPENQKKPQLYHRFSGANPLLRPYYKITQTVLNFIRNGWLTGFEDQHSDFLRFSQGYKYPEQIQLEQLITDHYKNLGMMGEVKVSDIVIDALFYDMCRLLLKNNDIVISTSPIYGHYFTLLNKLEAKLYLINTHENTGFKFTPAQLQDMLQTIPDAKVFLFIHPDNPTGVNYSKEELRAFADVFVAFNNERKRLNKSPLIVIVDEVIANLVYSKANEFTHLASITTMHEFTVTITSLSKDQSPEYAFAIMIGPPDLIKRLPQPLARVDVGKLISVAQVFKPENQNELKEHYERSKMVYQKHLVLFKKHMNLFNEKFQSENISLRLVMEPAAGFQILIQLNGLGGIRYPEQFKPEVYVSKDGIHTSLDFASFFRDNSKVELVPGEGFNLDGNLMMFRMSISKTPRQIKNFFKYLVDAILTLKPSLSNELRMIEEKQDDPQDNEMLDYHYLRHSRMFFTTATRTDYFEETSPGVQFKSRNVSVGP